MRKGILTRVVAAAFSLAAVSLAGTAVVAQDGSARGSNQANYHLMQLSVQTDRILLEDFQVKTRAIRSCGDAKKVAKELKAEVKRDRFVMPHQLPESLKTELGALETGHATQVFGDNDEVMRVIVICHRV